MINHITYRSEMKQIDCEATTRSYREETDIWTGLEETLVRRNDFDTNLSFF